jgi:PIN domain nuclease of toxin-antitoxin system
LRLLLDTHVLVWWLAGGTKLSARALELISDPANDVFVSAASVWEVAIKRALGKIRVEPEELVAAVAESNFRELPVTAKHAAHVARLPDHHRDPFDRLLVAQSLTEQAHLLTVDRVLGIYGPAVIVAL